MTQNHEEKNERPNPLAGKNIRYGDIHLPEDDEEGLDENPNGSFQRGNVNIKGSQETTRNK